MGRAVVGVALPYKERNIDKDPGQLPALATTNGSLYQRGLKTREGCQPSGHSTWEDANKTKT